jgi:hypothetical protein
MRSSSDRLQSLTVRGPASAPMWIFPPTQKSDGSFFRDNNLRRLFQPTRDCSPFAREQTVGLLEPSMLSKEQFSSMSTTICSIGAAIGSYSIRGTCHSRGDGTIRESRDWQSAGLRTIDRERVAR